MERYRGERYTPAWPYVAGILILLLLSVLCWCELLRVLERTAPALPPVEVVELPREAQPVEPVVRLVAQTVVEPTVDEVQPAIPAEPWPPYTEEELELLALVIYQEAGGDACSDETRLMVGTVVMNRVESDRFPDTVREVVLQPAQYGRLSWTGPVWPDRAELPQEAHAVKRAYEAAAQVLLGHRELPADTVYQAEFIQGSAVVAHLDDIYFCKE